VQVAHGQVHVDAQMQAGALPEAALAERGVQRPARERGDQVVELLMQQDAVG